MYIYAFVLTIIWSVCKRNLSHIAFLITHRQIIVYFFATRLKFTQRIDVKRDILSLCSCITASLPTANS